MARAAPRVERCLRAWNEPRLSSSRERDEAEGARVRALAAVAHLLGRCKGGPIVTPVGDDDGDASPKQVSKLDRSHSMGCDEHG